MNLSAMKQNIDLVAVIQAAGVPLRKQGNWHVGLCPFHEDTSPSFFVFPDGHFKCWGCSEYGDVIDFVQKFYNVDFKQSLGILGIEQDTFTPQKKEEIERLKHRCELVKGFRRWAITAPGTASSRGTAFVPGEGRRLFRVPARI